MNTAQGHSKKPVIISGIVTALYAFSPLVWVYAHNSYLIKVLNTGIFTVPNGIYCLVAYAWNGAVSVFALLCFWLLLWGFAYLLIRLNRWMRARRRAE